MAVATATQIQTEAQKPVETSNPEPTATPTANIPLPMPTKAIQDPTPLPTDTAEPTPRSLLNYVIDATMDYDTHTLEVQQEIDFPNPGANDIDDIILGVQPNRIQGVFELIELTYNEQPVNDYTLDGQRLGWKLAEPLTAGQTAHIKISYKLNLPLVEQGDPNLIRPQIFGVSERQINLTDWYPMLVPYQAQGGWLLHEPWYYGEHLVYPLANFDVSLHFTDPANQPVIAASASAEPLSDGSHYTLNNARDFVLAMGRQMKSVSAQIGHVTVSSYYYLDSENGGKAVLDATVKAVQTYTTLFGRYPHNTLAAVQGDFNDGMEFDGLYYLSNSFYNLYDDTEKNYLVLVAAHETSHQWWFGRVANDQNDEPWLDEALATYCEKLFYEKNYHQAVNWWWAYRIDFYQPEGNIDGSVPSYNGFEPYMNGTYRQGAHFLNELRQQIGDVDFFAFLKDYATQMDGKISSAADFFRILSEHSQVDISGLRGKYFLK